MKFNTLVKKIARTEKPLLAVLIDPDKFNTELVRLANSCAVFCFLVGGSRLESGNVDKTIAAIKKLSDIPVILFPGDETQLSPKADGLFLPSLLSGRNPDYLIGKQVIMAPLIRKMKLNVLPMAYLLLDGSKASATQRVTNTAPLDMAGTEHIVSTAIAAEQLGFQLLYLEAGSGAKSTVPGSLIRQVKKQVSLPIIVGGGINSVQRAKQAAASGASLVVVGNALEKNVYLLHDISRYFQ